MIHPNTKIQYIDLRDGEPRYKTIDDLYKEYAHRSVDCYQEYSYITFDNRGIKITELAGWTDLLEIRKIALNQLDIRWINLKFNNTEIKVSHTELIPAYESDKTIIGFHGEVKYLCTPKSPLHLSDNESVRTHKYFEYTDEHAVEFIRPTGINIIINPDITYGYQLITKSGFFNGNKIHLFACEYDDKNKDENNILYK